MRDISDAIGLSRGAVGDLAVGRNKAPNGQAVLDLDRLHREHCVEGNAKATREYLEALRAEHRTNGRKARASA